MNTGNKEQEKERATEYDPEKHNRNLELYNKERKKLRTGNNEQTNLIWKLKVGKQRKTLKIEPGTKNSCQEL